LYFHETIKHPQQPAQNDDSGTKSLNPVFFFIFLQTDYAVKG